MELLSYKDFLTEANINPLYREFRRRDKEINSKQMKLDFHFTDDMMKTNEKIYKKLLKKLDYINIGFEFEVFIKAQIDNDNFGYINTLVFKNTLYQINKYFQLKTNSNFINLTKTNSKIKTIYDNLDQELIDSKYQKLFSEIIKENFDNNVINFIEKLKLKLNPNYELIKKNQLDVYKIIYKKDKEYYKLLTLDNIAKKLSDKLNKQVIIFDKAHKKRKNINNWYIEPDDTLINENINDTNYHGLEFVSSVYPASEYKEIFNTFVEFINSNGFNPITNNDTGLHFSLSFNEEKLNSQINPLKLILFGKDKFLLKHFNREFNEYCTSQYDKVLDKLRSLIKNKKLVNNRLSDLQINSLIPKKTTLKTFTYNFNHYSQKDGNGYIEFRLLGNDYLKKFKELTLRGIDWFLFILVISASNELFEIEYKMILQNIIDSLIKENNNTDGSNKGFSDSNSQMELF